LTVATGLIGYGLGGAVFHAPFIQSCDRLSLKAIATSRDVPDGIAAVRDPLALIADPAVQLIVISTPNDQHFPLARAALEAGKHVVIDKPFTVSVAEADALIALAGERERVLSAFHNRRWDGDYLTVRKLVESGRLGELMLCELHWDRLRPAIRPGWRDNPAQGASLLNDLGPHLIDQALQLFGKPDALAADLAAQRPASEVDDYHDIVLHYGPRRVRLAVSVLVPAPRPRFALHGTEASFVKFGLDPQESQLQTGVRIGDPGFGVEDPAQHGLLTFADGRTERIATEPGRYLDYYDGVAAAILDGAPAPVDAADARDGLAIIEAARQSSSEGRRIAFA
jgi:scyllo-inositol 2-dehydrogenase (NADP+)